MTIQTLEKVQSFVKAMRFDGGRESAMEICRWVGNDSSYIPQTHKDPREYVQIPTMFGPRDITVGMWVVQLKDETYLTYKDEVLRAEFKVVQDEDHRLIKHARSELARFPNEDPEFIESIMLAIKGFASYRGHSGGSAEVAIHMLTALLKGENLAPPTDYWEEWELKEGENYGLDYDMWQNTRNSKAFSKDGGKTYFLTDEPRVDGLLVMHTSEDHNFVPQVEEEDLRSLDEKYEATSCTVPGHRPGRVNEDEGYFYCPDCEQMHPLVKKPV